MTCKKLLFPILAAVIALTGCGGGSGSGSGTASEGTVPDGSTGGGEARVETVIRTGDIFAVSGYDPQGDLIEQAIAEIDAIEAYDANLLRGIHGSNAISYTVGNRTSFVSFPSYERKRSGLIPILQTPDRAHAVAGIYRRQFGRFSLFGSAPPVLFNSGQNLGFEAPFRRLVARLLGDTPGAVATLAGNPTIVLARTHDTAILQAWFRSNLPNATVTVCSNDSELAACTSTAGLLVLGKAGQSARVAADTIEIDRLLRANKPVLYLHGSLERESAGSDAYSALFGAVYPYAGNFFTSETNRNSVWPNVDPMIAAIAGDNNAIKTALNHLDRRDFQFNWNAGLSGDTVDPAAVPGYEQNFGRAARAIRSGLNALDDRGISIFEQPVADFRLSRILALIGAGCVRTWSFRWTS